METRKTPLVLTASALAMALVLVGCGGGGSSSGSPSGSTATVQPTPPAMIDPPPVDEPEPMPLQLPTSMYLKGDDEPEMLKDATVMIAAGTTKDVGAYTFSCPGPEDCQVTITGDSVKETGGATVAFNADYMAKIEANKKTMSAEMDGRALGQHEALTRSDGVYDVFTRGPNAAGGPLMVTPIRIPEAFNPAVAPTRVMPDIVITRDLTGDLMVMRDRDGWQHRDPDMPPMDAASLGGTGWDGKVLKHTGGEQSITVYSNIENAKKEDFSADVAGSVYGPGPGGAGQNPGAIEHLPGASTNAQSVLTLTPDDMADAYKQGLLDPDYFPEAPAPGGGTKEYDYENGNPTADYRHTFSGYFHGASGQYACAAAGCTLEIDPATTTMPADPRFSDNWTFTPDQQQTPGQPRNNDSQIVKQDNDWLSFGWWIKEPKAPKRNNVYQYDAQVFYGGANPYDFARVGMVEGSAKYTGRAAGLYAVVPHMDKDKNEVPGARGEFMADAELTANFGNDTLSGKIDAFEAMGSEVDMSEWSLTLVSATIGQLANPNGVAGIGLEDGVVQSAATGKATAGQWQAALYGPSGSGNIAPRPTGVAGRFAANIDGNTAVAGGFGATR